MSTISYIPSEAKTIQLAIAVITVIAILFLAGWLSTRYSTLTRLAHEISSTLQRFPQRGILFVFVFVVAGRLCLLGVTAVPEPVVADEFSYLFMADTFAAGRLANPPHPLWTHFEPLFVLSQPTYSSIYPVAQGLILAAGKAIAGSYWIGVLVSSAIMCGVICWMLQAWFPPRWALRGSLLVILQFGVTGYWVNSYWGGSHAAIGGALLLGAFRRMELRRRATDSLLMGLGLTILANSRPYEGLVLGIVVLGLFLVRNRRIRALFPAAVVVVVGLSATLYYFSRVTGSPLHMPSQVYVDQYAIVPLFVWQKPRSEPTYHNPVVREAMLSCLADYERYSTPLGILRTTLWKLMSAGNFFLGPLVLLPLLMLTWVMRSRKLRPLLICCASVFAANAVVIPFEIHYAAPIAGAIAAINTYCLRRLWIARRYGNPIGDYLVPAAPLIMLALCLLSAFSPKLDSPLLSRKATDTHLRRIAGKHLVFVRYSAAHPPSNEWVFNGPTIDLDKIVWARDQGTLNADLVRYFPGRRLWIVDADTHPAKLTALGSDFKPF